MGPNTSHSLQDEPSWSVSYNGEVYSDARQWLSIWYFHDGPEAEFTRFEIQENVIPICKNPRGKRIQNPK